MNNNLVNISNLKNIENNIKNKEENNFYKEIIDKDDKKKYLKENKGMELEGEEEINNFKNLKQNDKSEFFNFDFKKNEKNINFEIESKNNNFGMKMNNLEPFKNFENEKNKNFAQNMNFNIKKKKKFEIIDDILDNHFYDIPSNNITSKKNKNAFVIKTSKKAGEILNEEEFNYFKNFLKYLKIGNSKKNDLNQIKSIINEFMKNSVNYKKKTSYKNLLIKNRNENINIKKYDLKNMKILKNLGNKNELTIYVLKCIIMILLIIFEDELNIDKSKIFNLINKKLKNNFLQEKFQQFLQIIFKKKFSDLKTEDFQNLKWKKNECNFNLIIIVFNHLFLFFEQKIIFFRNDILDRKKLFLNKNLKNFKAFCQYTIKMKKLDSYVIDFFYDVSDLLTAFTIIFNIKQTSLLANKFINVFKGIFENEKFFNCSQEILAFFISKNINK